MVSTRSTKRRSRTPPAAADQDRPKKAVKTPEKAKSAPKQSLDGVKVVLLDIGRTYRPAKANVSPTSKPRLTKVDHRGHDLPHHIRQEHTRESPYNPHCSSLPSRQDHPN